VALHSAASEFGPMRLSWTKE